MRREVKNKKVLSAITIGLATVIASTSIPMDVYAAVETEGPAQTSTEGSDSSETGSETSGSEANDAAITADEVDVATINTAEAAIDEAADSFGESAKSIGNSILAADYNTAKDYLEGNYENEEKIIVGADDELKKGLNKQDISDLNDVLVQSAVADANIEALKKALGYSVEEDGVTVEEVVGSAQLENSKLDDRDKIRKQYSVDRDEVTGDLIINEKNCPNIGAEKEADGTLQISGQYDTYPEKYKYVDEETGEETEEEYEVSLNNRSVQGTYQAGMDELKKAISARQNGNKDETNKALQRAEKYLNACEDKFDESSKALLDAVAQFNAASAAQEEAEKKLENVQDLINNVAIPDTKAAQAQIEAAKANAENLTALSDQYYGLMLRYFNNEVNTAKYVNGSLDVEASAEAALTSKKDNEKVTKGKLTEDSFVIGRELLYQLVTLKLNDEGATNITFGAKTGDADDGIKGANDGGYKNKLDVSIEKDVKGNDSIKKGTVDNSFGWQYRETSYNNDGRYNHFKVTYTDKDGQPQTKYYNIIYKGTNYANNDAYNDGVNVDLTKGICYVAELKYDGGKWSVDKDSEFLDDYTIYNEYREKLAKAEAEVQKLQAELKVLNEKVSTNRLALNKLEERLELAKTAKKNSEESLKDFEDLYMYLRFGKQPSEWRESDDGVVPPSGDDAVTGGDVVTGGGDVVTDDGADAGDDGAATVVDAGGATVTIPGIALPAGFTLNNVAVGGGANAAGGGNATIINDNGVPLANGNGAVTEAAGAGSDVVKQQNLVNKKNTTKIKDNEIPLAEVPNKDNEVTMNWMWLLIIFLLGATGKKMYDEYKKKKEAEEAAKHIND